MRLKTYTAPTIAQAMDMIRRELGDGAIILQTQGERGRHGARVIAAIEDRTPAANPHASRPSACARDPFGGPLADAAIIDTALARHAVPQALVHVLRAEASVYQAEEPALALSAALDTVVSFQPICERTQRRPILLFGAPGCGKTLTAAKLMVRARRVQRPVLAVSTDVARAGGLEQLEALARLAQVPLTAADGAAALTNAVVDSGKALVIIDTAGCNLFDDAELSDVQQLAEAVGAEPIFVLAAGGDRAESTEMAERAACIGCGRMIVSRIDIVRRLGSVLTAAEATGLAFADVGIGSQVANGLMPINPVSLARLLLPADEPDGSPST